jgi:positive phototaxis protein PixI
MTGRQVQHSQFLSFQMTPRLQAMLPTEHLGEILTLEPSQITPIFDLPDAVMGICNHRGEVLWIVDLACLVGIETLWAQNCRHPYSVMVVHRQQSQVGLAVRQVGHLVVCPLPRIQQLQSPLLIDITPNLACCLRGLYQSREEGTVLILDGEKILDLLKDSVTQ